MEDCSSLSHYSKAKRLRVLAVYFFLVRKFDLFRDQPLFILVTFKLNCFTNLQKLTVNKVCLVYHYVCGTSVIEKSGVLIAEPLFNYCLQKITFNLIFIFLPAEQAASHPKKIWRYTHSNVIFLTHAEFRGKLHGLLKSFGTLLLTVRHRGN